MTDDGYTLAEMLAALAILGMAMGGLGLVANLIARQQLAASRIHTRLVDDRAADRALGLWLTEQDAATLAGDDRRLSATCGDAVCSARLETDKSRTVLVLQGRSGPARRLRLRQRDVRFGYTDGLGETAAWPRPGEAAANDPRPAAPRAVLLGVRGRAAPLAVARVWTREPRDCQFDAIVGACRITTP
jgi:prepilin-type N-terminal cleavage/methylation domain-containing protein